MKTCPRCAEKIQDAAKLCRHCGYEYSDEELSNLDRKNRGAVFVKVAAIVVVALVIISQCSESDTTPSSGNISTSNAYQSPQPTAPVVRQSVKLHPFTWSFSGGGEYCEGGGTVTNTGDTTLTGLRFNFQFMNRKGELIGTGDDYADVRTIPPGGRSSIKMFDRCPSNSHSIHYTATANGGEAIDITP